MRGNDEHEKALAEFGIPPVDLLVVNLYPFETTARTGADYDTCIETIDIGGPALIRAAAKNHASVTVVVDPLDYARVLTDMEANDGATTLELRKALAGDLAVDVGRAERDRTAHYAVYAESVRNLGTPVFPRALFNAVLDRLGEAADILTVRHAGRPVASVLSLYHRGAVMPYWGGGTREAGAVLAGLAHASAGPAGRAGRWTARAGAAGGAR